MSKFVVQEAESLIGLAWKAVGLKEGLAGILMNIRHSPMQLEEGKRFVSGIEVEMVATVERIPFSGRLTGWSFGEYGEYFLLDRQPI